MLTEITEDNIQLIETANKSLLIFSAPWCGPCRVMTPMLETIAAANEDLVIGKISLDSSPDVAMKYDVMKIPSLLFFRNGEVIERRHGLMNKKEVQDYINNL